MKRLIFFAILTLVSYFGFAQKNIVQLSSALNALQQDPQFKHATLSIYVVDGNSGKLLLEKNAQQGLATASCLKVVTSASAFEMLGKDYRYKTRIHLYGNIQGGILYGGDR